MIAGATEVPVVGRAFLITVGWADDAVHVENDHLRRTTVVHLVDPSTGDLYHAALPNPTSNPSSQFEQKITEKSSPRREGLEMCFATQPRLLSDRKLDALQSFSVRPQNHFQINRQSVF